MPDQGKSAAWRKMEGCLILTILPAGYMAGLGTVADCMKDESIRPFLGSALLHEIMPNMGLTRETLEPMGVSLPSGWGWGAWVGSGVGAWVGSGVGA